jgi:hypothetical protein
MTDQLKAAAYTALWAFVGVFGLSLLGWVNDIASWANDTAAGAFPDVSVLAKAAVSAGAAAAAGLVTWVVRYAQSKGVLPGSGPTYPTV